MDLIGGTEGTVMVDSPLVVKGTITMKGCLKIAVSMGTLFSKLETFRYATKTEFMLNHEVPAHTHSYIQHSSSF